LSSVYLFWDVFWLVVAEAVYFVGLLITRFLLPMYYEDEEHHGDEGDGGEFAEEDSKSEDLAIWKFILYAAPAVCVMVGGVVVMMCKRSRINLRRCFIWEVAVILAAGTGAVGYAFSEYLLQFKQENCKELEGWNFSSFDIMYMALLLCPLFFRIGFLSAARRDLEAQKPPEFRRKKLNFGAPRTFKGFKVTVSVLDAFIMACFMPRGARNCVKSEHGKHIFQHCMQLVYESILLIVALSEAKYIELVAIGAGLLGSACGIIQLHRCDVLLNFFCLLLRNILVLQLHRTQQLR